MTKINPGISIKTHIHVFIFLLKVNSTAATHRVMMNKIFVSFGLAVKVQEGVALSLDPSVKVWDIANPIILRYESQRYMDRLKDRFLERMMDLLRELAKK